jgi:hypothetical protein
MYTFYTPLDFLEYPYTKTGENEVDGLAPEVPSGRENPRSSLHLDKTNESDTSADESDTSADEPDGTGADEPDGTGSTGSLTCQHDPTLQLLICLGVESGLGHSFSMVVGDDGGVTCTGSSPNYRPGQFMILNDSSNNTYAKHIVSIQCVGLGPSKWFLAIVQNKRTKNEWKFIAEEAAAATKFVPKDPKFHFILTLEKQGFLSFQAVGGDRRYLAFGSDGNQVAVTDKDRSDNIKQFQTLFSFSPIV